MFAFDEDLKAEVLAEALKAEVLAEDALEPLCRCPIVALRRRGRSQYRDKGAPAEPLVRVVGFAEKNVGSG